MKRSKHLINRFRLFHPIFRGYYLYGKGGGPHLLVLSSIIALFVVPFIILLGARLLGAQTYDLLGQYYEPKNPCNPFGSLWWQIMSQYTDPGNLPAASPEARPLAMVCALFGIVCLSGFLVSSLVNLINSQAENWKKGLRLYNGRLRKWFCRENKFIVIIGVNEQAPSIIRRAFDRGADFVFIQTKKNVEKARHDIELKMDDELEDRIVFYAGERTSAEDIKKLCLEKAMEVYILGESINDPNEKDHDAYNANCLEHISNYLREYKQKHESDKRLRVHVAFEYQSTFTAFKSTHLYQRLDRDIEFVPFNIHEIWAKKVLVDNFAIVPAGKKGELRVQRYNPIDTYIDKKSGNRLGITKECDKSVHLIILGMNQLGTALATQAALLCHFPNFKKYRNKRTTITFIDDHAKEEGNYFRGRFSTLFELCRHRTVICNGNNLRYRCENDGSATSGDISYVPFIDVTDEKYSHLVGEHEDKESFLDIEWEFIQGNIASDEVKKYIEDSAKDPQKITTIAICFNHSQQSIASAMYLPANVYAHANQVLVYQQNCFDIVDDVANSDVEWNRYPNLYPFGMIENSYTENPFENHLAKLLHYYYLSSGKIEKNEYLLKAIDNQWKQIDIVQKFANMDLADSIPMKYRSMGIDNPHNYDSIPEEAIEGIAYSEQLRFVVERLMMGFRCLSEEEQSQFVDQDTSNRPELYFRKRLLISKERAHLDICSRLRLEEVDSFVCRRKHNETLIIHLPELLKLAEWVSVLRLSDNGYKYSQHVKLLKDILTDRTQNTLHFHFIEGLNKTEKQADKTNHSFWMGETPVTQAQWKMVMGAKKMVDSEKYAKKYLQDDMPVVNVSKQDVDDFLDVLRKRTGLYFSLPSLKEWRFAAEKTVKESKRQGLPYKAWVNTENSEKKKEYPVKVTKLKKEQRSDTQLRHILGNVWEWTREEDNHHRFEFCGGSWRFSEREASFSDDYWHNAWEKEMKSDDLGFRLVWKFDVEKYGDTDLSRLMTVPKDTKPKRDYRLICNWFMEPQYDGEKQIMVNRMKLVKAGRFVMGANESIDKLADKNERPRHIVEITKDFYICNIPVTQQLWNLVNVEELRNPTTNRTGDNLPQTDVSWDKVNRFIKDLNTMKEAGLIDNALPDNVAELKFRLPTEAEWEYAAKGGHYSSSDFEKAKTVRPFTINSEGKEVECEYEVKDVTYEMYSGTDYNPEEVAWYEDSVIRKVAQKKPNKLGLYDMSGNVWEWCEDFYAWDMYNKGNVINPIGPEGYAAHVFRGGSWRSTKWDCRCTRANFWASNHKSNDLGFRLVLGSDVIHDSL